MIELIVNPEAGNGAAKLAGQQVADCLREKGIAFELIEPQSAEQTTALARMAAEKGVETVIACGGDGTITDVAKGLRGSQTALGIIPCGTGNDFVKVAGIPRDVKQAVEFCLAHPPRKVNTGTVNGDLFMNIFGTGFDVMVLDTAEKAKKRVKGIWPYLWGVICSIFTFKPFHMHIEIGSDTVLDGSYLLCAVSNGQYFGGGFPITPMAQIDDDLFDILVVDAVPNWKIPFYLPSLMKGTLHTKKISHHYRDTRCVVSYEGMRVNMDGEIRPMPRAEVECEKSQLLLHW